MSAGTASTLTIVRLPRGHRPPTQDDLRAAIERDRARLHLAAEAHPRDLAVAGPYHVTVDGRDLDEYVVWER